MGICASCLGLNRQYSQDPDEIDRILADDRQLSYGTLSGHDAVQPDEEELRRERQALDDITAEASDHMIDAQYSLRVSLYHNIREGQAIDGVQSRDENAWPNQEEQSADADEAAWLESIQSSGLDSIRVPENGTLVVDIGRLHDGNTQIRTSGAVTVH